jgi:hypothetical protein
VRNIEEVFAAGVVVVEKVGATAVYPQHRLVEAEVVGGSCGLRGR